MEHRQGTGCRPGEPALESNIKPHRVRRPANNGPRINREKLTVSFMIGRYCSGHHDRASRVHSCDNGSRTLKLCRECYTLHRYAMKRLNLCQFGEEKSTCVECKVHCYKPGQRLQIKEVMRYSGPRMLLRHPVLTMRHLLDQRRDKHNHPAS
ncbi:nitrous oxide-stimulated promoter family protein [Paenibacillus sp. YPG26]|uniref:nitrous oxide-stimulated promoter family protein n=1 Tax=Paenibacillus sp. YPG26 TaxID=2878915 RepID=UPI00203DD2E8|nr:nitrous oxide-stimulated promoter family protein [Paenibacillus sp. YPG26]USB32999.1 nitrous oxide-stimulated promoter family protein [Paenibacillus sp. YPG26]